MEANSGADADTSSSSNARAHARAHMRDELMLTRQARGLARRHDDDKPLLDCGNAWAEWYGNSVIQ